ncbi:hypothetical protein [Lagierella sp.]|uniref:hypothetical protein n=1 Tax=Lagierella sp. TaxID=2849657 RepID=UPI002619E1D1|nr:hypothetical protein [Lagierella sp.]
MGKRDRAELKKLKEMKAQEEAELQALKLQERNIRHDISVKRLNINSLNQRIEKIYRLNENAAVSDHAIVRYFERVLGVDLEEVSEKILPPEMEESVETLGSGHFPINEGEFKIVVKNGVVVTVLTEPVEES